MNSSNRKAESGGQDLQEGMGDCIQFDAQRDHLMAVMEKRWNEISVGIQGILNAICDQNTCIRGMERRMEAMEEQCLTINKNLKQVQTLHEANMSKAFPKFQMTPKVEMVGNKKTEMHVTPPSRTKPRTSLTPKPSKKAREIPPSPVLSKVIMDISSDDDDATRFEECVNLAEDHVSRRLSNVKKTFQHDKLTTKKVVGSAFRRVQSAKPHQTLVNAVNSAALQARRLSFTHSPTDKRMKKIKIESASSVDADIKPDQQLGGSSRNKDIARGKKPACDVPKTVPPCSPELMKTLFEPTKEMGLNSDQPNLAEYVFSNSLDQSEVLFLMGETYGTRKDFQRLCPGVIVEQEIVLFMALKINWTQSLSPTPTVWAFPPSFVVDVMKGTNPSTLTEKYLKDWMPAFDNLHYVYIPIQDCCGVWYMAVISVTDQTIYFLETSCMSMNDLTRKTTIRTLCAAISQIVFTQYMTSNSLTQLLGVDGWEISVVEGINNTGPGRYYNSAIWVLNWMDMEDFFNPYICGEMDEDSVRMKTCMGLLQGIHNQCRAELQMKADSYCNTKCVYGI